MILFRKPSRDYTVFCLAKRYWWPNTATVKRAPRARRVIELSWLSYTKEETSQ